MEIYIETFLLQNIIINLCLLKIIKLTTKSQTNFFKLILASLFGTIPSVLIVFYLTNPLILNSTKILSATIMLLIAFKPNKKEFIFHFILLFIFTYALGGIAISLNSKVYHTQFGIITTSKYSLEFICLIVIVSTQIFELVTKHLKNKILTSQLIYNLTLTKGNNHLKINAYMDTGNFLNYEGKPVLILDLNSYLKLTKTSLISFFTNKTTTLKSGTINGSGELKIFEIDKIEFKYGKKNTILHNQIIAVNTSSCFKNTNYQALMSPLFL